MIYRRETTISEFIKNVSSFCQNLLQAAKHFFTKTPFVFTVFRQLLIAFARKTFMVNVQYFAGGKMLVKMEKRFLDQEIYLFLG